jgi:hypothetical protein
MVTNTESLAVGSAGETAVTTTSLVCPLLLPVVSTGTELGATNNPLVEIAPVAGPPPVTPFTFHVAGWLAIPFTVAVNCIDPNVLTRLDPSGIDTVVLDPAWMVTAAVPDFAGSAADNAVIVTLGGLGTAVGARYTPAFEINPCVESPLFGSASAICQNML